MNRFTKSIALVALVGAFTLVSAAKSEAAMELHLCSNALCSGGTNFTVTDGSAQDVNPGVGAITYIGNGGVAGFSTIQVNSAFGVPVIGSPTAPQLDLHFSAIGTGNLFIGVVDGEFALPSQSYTMSYGGTTQGQATVYAYNEATLSFLSAGPFGGAFSGTLGVNVTNPYYLAIGVNVLHATQGISTGDLHLVPEPLTLSLLGLGLAGIAARRRAARR